MIKKVEISDIRIDNYTVREAMLKVESFLSGTAMSTIEDISMEMLVKAGEDETLKECIQSLDLSVISEKEILKAAGVNSQERERETVESLFFTEFMKRIARGENTVCLFAATRSQLAELEEYVRRHYQDIKVLGQFSLEDCVGDMDGLVNEINAVSPDVILSVLPVPKQEYFLMEHKVKMDARIWYGLGGNNAILHDASSLRSLARRMMHKGRLKSMVSKSGQEK